MSPVIAPGKLMPLMPLPLEPRAFERVKYRLWQKAGVLSF